MGGLYGHARERDLGGIYRAYLECSMSLFTNQLITVACRQCSELWLFTVQGRQVVEMRKGAFALSLLKTESFSGLKCKIKRSKEGTVCVRWILERCELLANPVFEPPLV